MFEALKKIIPTPAATSGRPPIAVELTSEGVLAGAAAAQPTLAWVPLAADANDAAKTSAIRSALDQLSTRGKQATLIVPDSAARVFLLDFDTLPHRVSEALPVLRFRLRKMLPFDAETAAISYQALTSSKQQTRVLVTVMPHATLTEYETILRNAGYEPGAVLPSSLAALAALHSTSATLTAHLAADTLTTTITSGDDVLLYRTLLLPATELEAQQEITRAISVAAAFYEDSLGLAPTHLHYAGLLNLHSFTQLLGEENQLAITPIADPSLGYVTTTGGNPAAILGALSQHTHPTGAAA